MRKKRIIQKVEEISNIETKTRQKVLIMNHQVLSVCLSVCHAPYYYLHCQSPLKKLTVAQLIKNT